MPVPELKATELSDAELSQFAASDEAMLLTDQEQRKLVARRQQCASLGREVGLSLFQNASRHAFKLVAGDNGKRLVCCIGCVHTMDAGHERFFLNNFYAAKAGASGATEVAVARGPMTFLRQVVALRVPCDSACEMALHVRKCVCQSGVYHCFDLWAQCGAPSSLAPLPFRWRFSTSPLVNCFVNWFE